jgi:4-amino-4-deoxy-L-arabinose transferase-like glycosyltransferase
LDSTSRNALYLLIAAVLLFFFGLGSRDFWAPVEPRYGEIARVMFAKGEWIVPTVNGDLYTDKPILYFWLVLLASKLTGTVSEWTVRLPAAFGGVGMVLTTYYFGRDFFSARIGFIAASVLATCVRVIWEARWAHIDALFCFFFTLAIYFGARALLRQGKPKEVWLAYACMALATLAKGLIGIVLPGLLFAAYVCARRDWRMIVDAKLPVGIFIFLAISTPWVYLVYKATDGRWLADFIYIHHLQRYTSGVGHRQPFYYYFTTLPVDFMPWTVFAVTALIADRDYRKAWTDPGNQFFVLWFIVVWVFFSLSDTKRDLYLMPLLPPLALFVGNYIDGIAAGRWPQDSLARWLPIIFFALVALVGFSLPIAAWILRREAFVALLPASAVLAGGGLCAAYLLWRRRPLAVLASVSAMMAASVLAVSLWIFPYLERFKSPRPFSLEINQIVPTGAPLYIYADTMNDFNYYTERERMPILSTPAAVEALIAKGENGFMLIKERDLKRLARIPREAIVAADNHGSTTWYLIDFKRHSNVQ